MPRNRPESCSSKSASPQVCEAQCDSAEIKTPRVAVDAVVFDEEARLLLIRRKNEPFKGRYALPGGFLEVGETTEAACRRELKEETGLDAGLLRLVGVYSDPGRDPRGHTVSVVYTAVVKAVEPSAGDDAASAHWKANWRRMKLAFDHSQIVKDAHLLFLSVLDDLRKGK